MLPGTRHAHPGALTPEQVGVANLPGRNAVENVNRADLVVEADGTWRRRRPQCIGHRKQAISSWHRLGVQ